MSEYLPGARSPSLCTVDSNLGDAPSLADWISCVPCSKVPGGQSTQSTTEKCDLGSGGPEVADHGFAACS